jgi:hypothetical protein
MMMWDDEWYLKRPVAADSAEARVLVVVVPSLEDWQRITSQRWYRIPLRRAPQRIGAEYLAFYHTQASGPLRWSIRFYAPIQGYRLATRRELIPEEPEHPRADERYYRIALGPIQALPNPIPSQHLRRVTFILTTLARLLQAEEIRDLWQRESRPDDLRRALRLSERCARYGLVPV